jgi:mannose-6-phosphate isomerase-like protein (cupin superfamily)
VSSEIKFKRIELKFWKERTSDWREVLPGVKRRILSWDKDVMLVLYNISANTVIAKHSHVNAQHGLVIKGGGMFEFSNGKRYEIRANEAYYVPPYEDHMLLTGPAPENIFLDVFLPPRKDFIGESREPDIIP